jgi:hypothetical protein
MILLNSPYKEPRSANSQLENCLNNLLNQVQFLLEIKSQEKDKPISQKWFYTQVK